MPIAPYAIQLKVFGPESHDAELAAVTRQLLASLDGPTNWLTDDERAYRLGKGVGQLVVYVAAVVVVIVAVRHFRAKRRTPASPPPASPQT